MYQYPAYLEGRYYSLARPVETPGWAEMGQSIPETQRGELLEPTSPSKSQEDMAEAFQEAQRPCPAQRSWDFSVKALKTEMGP